MLEPVGARPVIVEDDAFVGGGSRALDGVIVGAARSSAPGVILTGTSRLYDLVRGRELSGHARRPLVVPPGASSCPDAALAGAFAREHGLVGRGGAHRQGPRRRDGARVALEDALR